MRGVICGQQIITTKAVFDSSVMHNMQS